MYAQSFVLGRSYTNSDVPVVANLPFELYKSDDLPISVALGNRAVVALLGEAVIPELSVSSTQEVADWLCVGAATVDDVWEKLAKVSGRFVAIVHERDGETYVLPDATASRSVFYGGGIVASHAHLIADLLGLSPSPAVLEMVMTKEYREGIWHLPGKMTAFDGVSLLTSNTLLAAKTGEITPMALVGINAVELKELASLIARTYSLLRDHNEIVISLTAGVDSRITFAAALSDGRPFTCYTYVTNAASRRDQEVARRLCDQFGVAHQTIEVGPANEDFRDRHRRATGYIRNEKEADTIWACSRQFPKEKLELKSSISEVGRAFYRRRMFAVPAKLSARRMTALYKNWLPRRYKELARAAFTGMPDLARHQGCDALDMFYWEHRLSAWQGLQLQDYDMSHRTMTLFNNRDLLRGFLALPLDDRMDDSVQRGLVRLLHRDVPLPPLHKSNAPKKLVRTAMYYAMAVL